MTDIENYIREDWFAPAVVTSGSVDSCLDAVEVLLSKKTNLIREIRRSLVSGEVKGSDKLTLLGARLAPIEQTIIARVEVLRIENTQSWFRAPAAVTRGPFQHNHLQVGVFSRYAQKDEAAVKKSIKIGWKQNDVNKLFFGKDNLWGELIEVKSTFYDITNLQGDFKGANLLRLRNDIDPLLQTPSLQAFLKNVQAEALHLEARIEHLFKVLWGACEKFWSYQSTAHRQEINFKAFKDEVSKMRGAFRRRREKTTKPKFGNPEQSALNMMGFRKLPNIDELKSKYREMARNHHPDMGGDEVNFKKLNESYAILTRKISEAVEFTI